MARKPKGSGSKANAAKRGSRADATRRERDAEYARVIREYGGKVTADDVKSLNEGRRSPVALLIRSWTHDPERLRKRQERRHDRKVKRARRRLDHPNAKRNRLIGIGMVGFVLLCVVSVGTGLSVTHKDGNTNQTGNVIPTPVRPTLTERNAIRATGIYSTFLLHDGIPADELLDAHVTAKEYPVMSSMLTQRTQEKADEQAKKQAEDDAARNQAKSDAANEAAANANASGNENSESSNGTLSDEQKARGQSIVQNAVAEHNAKSANGNDDGSE